MSKHTPITAKRQVDLATTHLVFTLKQKGFAYEDVVKMLIDERVKTMTTDRAPSAHSMTHEPETTREDLAQKVFVLERDNARLLKDNEKVIAALGGAERFVAATVTELGIFDECTERTYDDSIEPVRKAIAAIKTGTPGPADYRELRAEVVDLRRERQDFNKLRGMLTGTEAQLVECSQQRAQMQQELDALHFYSHGTPNDVLPAPVWRWPPPVESDKHDEVRIAILNAKIRRLTTLCTALSAAALED